MTGFLRDVTSLSWRLRLTSVIGLKHIALTQQNADELEKEDFLWNRNGLMFQEENFGPCNISTNPFAASIRIARLGEGSRLESEGKLLV